MAIKDVENFYIKVKQDDELRKELKSIKHKYIDGKLSPLNAEQFIEMGMIPLAKKYGIDFTLDDLMDYASKSHANMIQSQKESLSSNDLGAVSGGKDIVHGDILYATNLILDMLN